MKHTRVVTVMSSDIDEFDEEVNRIIKQIEYDGGEVVNVQLAIHSTKVFDLYAMIVYRC